MQDHDLKNITETFPKFEINLKSIRGNRKNTNINRENGLKMMKATPEYKRRYNPKTRMLEIWYMKPDRNCCKITLWTSFCSTIRIDRFYLEKNLHNEKHQFHPDGFSASVNEHLLSDQCFEQQTTLVPADNSMNIVENFPFMKSNGRGNNTNQNRDKFLEEMSITPEYKREFDYKTGLLEIWFVRKDDFGCRVSMYNKEGSRSIGIQYFSLGEKLDNELHEFNPLGFSESVNKHLLTPEDLEQQRAFRQQQQERKDALKQAHNSIPKTCGGDRECEHCQYEKRQHEMFYCRGYT